MYTVQMVSSVHLQRKPDELPIFEKHHTPGQRSKKEDMSGETRTYGNPMVGSCKSVVNLGLSSRVKSVLNSAAAGDSWRSRFLWVTDKSLTHIGHMWRFCMCDVCQMCVTVVS